jgi:flagellar protein FliL
MALFKKKPKAGEEAPSEEEAAAAKPAAEGEAGAAEGEGAAAKKGLPLKLIIIGAAAGLVLVGGGGGAFMMLSHPAAKADAHKSAKSKKKKDEKGGDKTADKNGPQIADGPDGVVFYTLPDIVVNMQSADGKPTYLKLKLTLELPDEDTVDVIQPNMPRLQDMFQTFLRELRPEDLAGSQGSYQLRVEILRRVNLVIAPAKINSVLIEEMLIN